MEAFFLSQVPSLLFFTIMQDYFEPIEEKDQICTRKTETLHSNATHSKGIFGSSDRSLLNTLKLNLTSRRFDCDNFRNF